jgi:hypothetical protein
MDRSQAGRQLAPSPRNAEFSLYVRAYRPEAPITSGQ